MPALQGTTEMYEWNVPQSRCHLYPRHTSSLIRDTCRLQKCSIILPQVRQNVLQNSEFIFAYAAFLVPTCRDADVSSRGAQWNWHAKGRTAGPPHFQSYSHSPDKYWVAQMPRQRLIPAEGAPWLTWWQGVHCWDIIVASLGGSH